MKLFLRYLKQRRRSIGVFFLFLLVFLVTFRLYHLPAEPVMYPAVLCAMMGLLLMGLDFFRVKHWHQKVSRITDLTDILSQELPVPDGIEERDYENIIRLLTQEQSAFRSETSQRYNDMVEYYTVWAHQIKTPIASMRLHLQNEDSPLTRALLLDLFRVEQYVEMVLMFLKLEEKSRDYCFKANDLDTIIRQTVKKFSGEFIDRKLRLCYEPIGLQVITDEKWLSFVIEQVLSNALKYTPSGSITISLQSEQTLCIRDTGIGIAPEDLPRIFEKGYTGCNGRLDKKASGIGLYLCRRICNDLGHRIRVESVLDEGTCVTIDFSRQTLEVE